MESILDNNFISKSIQFIEYNFKPTKTPLSESIQPSTYHKHRMLRQYPSRLTQIVNLRLLDMKAQKRIPSYMRLKHLPKECLDILRILEGGQRIYQKPSQKCAGWSRRKMELDSLKQAEEKEKQILDAAERHEVMDDLETKLIIQEEHSTKVGAVSDKHSSKKTFKSKNHHQVNSMDGREDRKIYHQDSKSAVNYYAEDAQLDNYQARMTEPIVFTQKDAKMITSKVPSLHEAPDLSEAPDLHETPDLPEARQAGELSFRFSRIQSLAQPACKRRLSAPSLKMIKQKSDQQHNHEQLANKQLVSFKKTGTAENTLDQNFNQNITGRFRPHSEHHTPLTLLQKRPKSKKKVTINVKENKVAIESGHIRSYSHLQSSDKNNNKSIGQVSKPNRILKRILSCHLVNEPELTTNDSSECSSLANKRFIGNVSKHPKHQNKAINVNKLNDSISIHCQKRQTAINKKPILKINNYKRKSVGSQEKIDENQLPANHFSVMQQGENQSMNFVRMVLDSQMRRDNQEQSKCEEKSQSITIVNRSIKIEESRSSRIESSHPTLNEGQTQEGDVARISSSLQKIIKELELCHHSRDRQQLKDQIKEMDKLVKGHWV